MSEKKHWLTPPDLYNSLFKEFQFDFDPSPYPRPANFNGLEINWGKMNYVNPLFLIRDCDNKKSGPTAFVRKAISEQAKGKSSFLTLPSHSYLNLLLEAGAIPRSLGRVKWLDCETKEPMKSPNTVTGFFLPGHNIEVKNE